MRIQYFFLPIFLSTLIAPFVLRPSQVVAEPMIEEYSERSLTKREQRRRRVRRAKRRVKKKGGLRVLPASGEAIRSRRKKNRMAITANGRVVSGEPPRLVELSSDPANTFWESGLVDAIANDSASQDQCNSFWSGNNDGDSAGFGACQMAEGLGRALEIAADGGTSLCYMKNFPSEANLQAGGLTVVSGTLPDNDITKIFSPGESIKLVQVDISNSPSFGDEEEGEQDHSIFIRVSPNSESFFYKAELWFCDGEGESAQVSGTDVIEIAKSGKITSRNENMGSGGESFYSEFEGYLRPAKGGVLQYDKDRPRTAKAGAVFGESSFKVDLEIRGRQVNVKTRSGGDGGDSFLNTSVMRFSGNSPEEIRFREGAFRSIFNGNDSFDGVAEWRDTFYAAAPGSSLSTKIQSAEEMNNDSFFQTGPDVSLDFSAYSCGVTPDIHVSLDFSNQTLLSSVTQCQPLIFSNLDFCFGNQAVNAAQENFGNACSGGL